MFDRFILASNFDRIATRFNRASLVANETYTPSYSIAAGDKSYVITDSQKREIKQFKFGMSGLGTKLPKYLPFVRAEGDRNLKDDPYYSGSKAIFLKPEFRNIIRQQRCVVLADAFVVGIEKKNPYLVYLRDKQRPFAFAALWNCYFNDEVGEEVNSFAIITTTANKLIQHLGYKRMPVILKQQCESRWLRSSTQLSEALDMLSPYPFNLMNAYPISTKIEDLNINNKSLVQPCGKPVLHEPKNVPYVRVRKQKENHCPNITLAERMKISK